MKKVIGEINYSVGVTCPHCKEYYDLTMNPYAGQDAEDKLGLCVFGKVNEPAKWDKISIEYICDHCKNAFTLTGLEY